MTESKARALAAAIGGKVVNTMPQPRMWGVALTRADGRYVLLEENAGAVYHDEHACWTGYQTFGSDPKGDIHAEEWIDWNGSEKWARDLSILLGSAEYWHSGGGIWLVLFTRRDGRFSVIGEEGAEVYRSQEHWEAYDDSTQDEPERFVW